MSASLLTQKKEKTGETNEKQQKENIMSNADHSASLVSTLAEDITGSYVGSGYYCTSVGSDDALDIASDLIDGSLSDTSVLVQIPKVREAIELLAMLSAAAVFSPLHPQHGTDEWETLDSWIKALLS